MSFVNTVDVIGDEALPNSIIDRSITEIADNLTASIGSSAFYNCSALTTADFPAATSIGGYAFNGCTALTTADFPAATSIDGYAFQNCTALPTADFPAATSIGQSAFQSCSKLTALILRSETMCTLSSTNAFKNTPIASGTGYIYVPRALVDSYKAANRWSTYANQIRAIEDYPAVCTAKDTWEGVMARMDAGTYATDYAIGDCIPLDLGSEGVINMQIAAFDADDLADGSGKAKITWIAKELLATSRRMNPARAGSDGAYTLGTGGVGGWENSELRSVLKNTVKPLIPAVVQIMIAEVTKSQYTYDAAGAYSTQTTTEDVWLPSTDELAYGIYSTLFPNAESRIKYRLDGSVSNWWTRDAASTSAFHYVDSGNPNISTAAANSHGIALSFCTN